METSASESGGCGASPPQAPPPAPMPTANAPPPFLVKTYEMVDDSSTNNIVSWSSTNNSFVVWDPPEFERNLLPKYFKHNNFSSFVRQLNTYGFRKVDPDRWEFANEGFLRGQKHLLKTITRRKPTHGQLYIQPTSSVGACVEVGKFGLEKEVERLKRDKNVLMQEIVHLRQQQQGTDTQLQTMVQRIQGMEQRQQQMMSFLAKAVNSPGFLAQFVQQDNSNRRLTQAIKKRRLKPDDDGNDGQIIKYQPLINDIESPLYDSTREIAGGSHSILPLDYRSPLQDSSTEPVNGAFLDPTSLVMNDNDFTTLLDDDMDGLPGSVDPFWEKFLESPDESNSTHDDLQKGIEINEWGNNGYQHLEQLAAQMGNLSSEANNV